MSDRQWVLTQWIVLLGALAAIPALGVITGWPLTWPTPMSGAVGGLVVLAGFVIDYRAGKTLGRQLTPMPTPTVGAQLIERGIFGRVRHPVYLGLLLIVLGWWLMWLTPPTFAAVVGVAVFFDAKSAREEELLIERFPGYGAYMERVRYRMIPGVL